MLAAMLLAADLSGSFSVSDRTELRGRAPGTAPMAASLDAETALTARLSLASRRLRTSLAYTPRLTLWDIGSRVFAPTQLQGGEARLEWLGRRAQLSLAETASYGGLSFASSSLPPGPEGQPPHVEAIPTQIVQFVSSTTTLASRVMLRRWAVDTAFGYQLAGGADAAARAVMPLQTGPFGDATIEYAATRREHSVTRLSVVEAAFSSGTEALVAEADEGLRHVWSRLTETRLSLARARAGSARRLALPANSRRIPWSKPSSSSGRPAARTSTSSSARAWGRRSTASSAPWSSDSRGR
jgi:hypothetical protein